MTITQTIPEYEGEIPDKATMSPDEFDEAAEDWVNYQASIALALNTWAQQANAIGVDSSDLLTALAAVNFKGEWGNLTGPLNIPACVFHDDKFWMLLANLADVTASEPADANSDWAVFPVGAAVVAKTGNFNVTQAQIASGITTLTNEAATGDIEFQLPARGVSGKIHFMVIAGHYMKIKPPSGERIYFYNNQQTAVDGYIPSNMSRTHFGLICTPTFGYTVINLQGDVKVDE